MLGFICICVGKSDAFIVCLVLTDTVAGVGVGCLLLGTALGVTFSCIAFRRRSLRKRNLPFKLDEDEDDFRDDEGL